MAWFDAHCHLSDTASLSDFDVIIDTALQRGIQGWLSTALNKEQLRWHQINRRSEIRFSAGIHPFYSEGTAFNIDELDELASEKRIFALGEIGLDKRNRDLKAQILLLQSQLEIARNYDLPCVFHVVGHLDVFFKILSEQPVRGIWHGFSGSSEIVRQFSPFGLTFSMGQKLVTALKHDVINTVIAYGNFLIETDSPFNLNKPEQKAGTDYNPLLELINYARIMSKLNGIKLDALQQYQAANIKQYIK